VSTQKIYFLAVLLIRASGRQETEKKSKNINIPGNINFPTHDYNEYIQIHEIHSSILASFVNFPGAQPHGLQNSVLP